MRFNIALGGALGMLVSACAGASQTPCVEPAAVNAQAQTPIASSGSSAPAGVGSDMVTGVAPKRCAGEPMPASDGSIDDFEDGDTQLAKLAGRDGYWWTAQDPNGSTMEPMKFAAANGGAGSPKAAHFTGTTSSASGAWGVNFGVNFVSAKAPYDGSKYAGISFKAKAGPNGTKQMRFKIGDVNTHQDAGVCKACWNHFGADITLSDQWQEYKVLFADAKQADGWGSPRPATLTTDKLWNIDFSIGPGAAYDVWVDDVRFLSCP